MKKKLKLMTNFFIYGIGPVDEQMVISLSEPCSLKSVTVDINPSISYTNNDGKEYLEANYTPRTKKNLHFDLKKQSTKKIKIAKSNYTITLTDIGKIRGKKDEENLYFKFLIVRD